MTRERVDVALAQAYSQLVCDEWTLVQLLPYL